MKIFSKELNCKNGPVFQVSSQSIVFWQKCVLRITHYFLTLLNEPIILIYIFLRLPLKTRHGIFLEKRCFVCLSGRLIFMSINLSVKAY